MKNEKMLEHQKIILNKVYNDKELFRKELLKCLEWLNKEELDQLHFWLVEEFWDTHKAIINEAFHLASA